MAFGRVFACLRGLGEVLDSDLESCSIMIAYACEDPGFSLAPVCLLPVADSCDSRFAVWLLRTGCEMCDSRCVVLSLACVLGGGCEFSFLRLETDGFRKRPLGSPMLGDDGRETDGRCEPLLAWSRRSLTESDCILCLAGPALAIDAFEALEMLRRFFLVFEEVPGKS